MLVSGQTTGCGCEQQGTGGRQLHTSADSACASSEPSLAAGALAGEPAALEAGRLPNSTRLAALPSAPELLSTHRLWRRHPRGMYDST